MEKELHAPKWALITVEIIGICAGVIAFINGCITVTYGGINVIYGLIPMIFGVLLIVLGIWGLVVVNSKTETSAFLSYLIGSGWCLYEALSSIFLGIYSINSSPDLSGVGIMLIIIALIMAAAFILLLLAGLRIRSGRPFRSFGRSGSIVFLVCAALALVSLIISLSNSPLTYLLDISLIVMASFLLIISLNSVYDEGSGVPVLNLGEGWEAPAHEEAKEEETVKALKAYKELLDAGAITEAEYEEKKAELLHK